MKHNAPTLSAAAIVLAATGLDCGAEVAPADVVVELAGPDEPSRSSERVSELRDRPESTAMSEAERTVVAPGLELLEDVSSARGDDGATYVAGLFSGTLTSGDFRLQSHGYQDVYLARIERDGRVAWARAVGSKREERDPRVTFEDGEVKLFAFTDGQVDCGRGPLGRTWSSPMFFFCVFERSGQAKSGGTFPTGNP